MAGKVGRTPTDQGTNEAPAIDGESGRFEAKSIVLFSDGTGNSSAKLFKTNVWRMYEATDLGPTQANQPRQIAYYDDGVGTSAFKPLAILGGVFGIGLARNVRDIYRYVCRNYQPAPGQQPGQDRVEGGDEIYGFGFSRGAFTMRVAIAMIAHVGLAVTRDERELDRRAKEAWRIYRLRYRPRSALAPSNLWRRLVIGQKADEADRKALHEERSRNFHPVIRFVGVWDTVSAYGGPVSEITRAIDNWVVRLSMPNYELSDSVRRARHALSIDDERDSFHPLLWDELHEEGAIANAGNERPWIDAKRLEQVWFTGMHADVGGGYSDESLSYVSFLWMMEEAKAAGLRVSPVVVERFRALANSAGPIHDSRRGVRTYYRYRPRRIAVWMEPIDADLLTRRHPDRKRGLIRVARVHESVAARIASGTDRYAPLPLPALIKVAPSEEGGEVGSQERPDGVRGDSETPAPRLISADLRKRFEDETRGRKRVADMEAVWARVRRRRFLYFASLLLTLALAAIPIWADDAPTPPVLASGHGLTGWLIALLAAITPGVLANLVQSWANHPFFLLLLLTLLYFSNRIAGMEERNLRDRARAIWNEALGLPNPVYRPVQAETRPEETAVEIKEEPAPSPGQQLRRFVRWRVIPALVFVLGLVLLAWLLVIAATRTQLAYLERDGFCPASAPQGADAMRVSFAFDTGSTCHPTGLTVLRGRRYLVEMNLEDAWWDSSYPADPRGLGAGDIPFWGHVALPLRRAVTARYLQPVAHIGGGTGGPTLQPLELRQRGTPITLWRGEFTARRTGTLSLFANDAAIVGSPLRFYHNNRGSARVTITDSGGTGAGRETHPAGAENRQD